MNFRAVDPWCGNAQSFTVKLPPRALLTDRGISLDGLTEPLMDPHQSSPLGLHWSLGSQQAASRGTRNKNNASLPVFPEA